MIQGTPAREIWEAALGEIQLQVSRTVYRTWFEKTTGNDYSNGKFVVGVPNSFCASSLESHCSLIEKTLIKMLGQSVIVGFEVAQARNAAQSAGGRGPNNGTLLNPQYTFDSFVSGQSNNLALGASKEVSRRLGWLNPLVIYGRSGLGKTHLLQAIGHAALEQNKNVVYCSAEQYTNEFIAAVHEHTTGKFIGKYRNADLLLVDDIRFLFGKKSTEESFLYTIDSLHNKNGQVTVTSDCPPKEMQFSDERLSSRFQGGLAAELQPPDFQTRIGILRARAKARDTEVPDDVLDLIAQTVHRSIRELEGSLNAVIAYARMLHSPLTQDVAEQAMANREGRRPEVSCASLVLGLVAAKFQLTPEDLIGKKRDKEVALARHVAVYILKEATSFSLGQIGKELGARNASTITRAYDRIAADLTKNPSLHRQVEEIKQQFSDAYNRARLKQP